MRRPRKRPSRKRQEAEAKKASERLHDRKRQSTDDAKQRRDPKDDLNATQQMGNGYENATVIPTSNTTIGKAATKSRL